jgi:hypothetical protein
MSELFGELEFCPECGAPTAGDEYFRFCVQCDWVDDECPIGGFEEAT